MRNTRVGPSRSRTRGIVLDLIRGARTVSRVELVASSGLTGATITNVVRELIVDGFVLEVGQTESRGGKPRTLLQLNPLAGYTVGVQLDRCSSVIAIINLASHMVARTSMGGSGGMSPRATLEFVADHLRDLLASVGVDRDKVLGVGLVSHGPQDRARGLLLTPQPTPEFLGYPLAHELEVTLGMPVLLDNDATAAAIGEYWVGGVDPAATYGSIYMASGLGGGVVVGGEVYRGSSSNGVEIGHISADPHGEPCSCGNRGCIGNYAAPIAVIEQARAVPGLAVRLRLTNAGSDDLVNFARIARAAANNDSEALPIIEGSARYLGRAAVTLTNLFDLDRIILAGPSFSAAGSIYLAIVQDELDRASFTRHVRRVVAALSANGSDAAAIGGAVLVLRSTLTPLHRSRIDNQALRATVP